MPQYKISNEGLKAIRKLALVKSLPIFLVALFIGGAIAYTNEPEPGPMPDMYFWIVPVMVVLTGIMLFRTTAKLVKMYASYTLTLTENTITREQENTPDITMYFSEIEKIVKAKNGAIVLKGKDAANMVIVFPQIENYEELEKKLNDIMPMTVNTSFLASPLYQWMVIAGTLGLMFCFFTQTNKIIEGISGTLLLGLMVWSLYNTQRSKNIDARTKRIIWIVLLPMVAILVRMLLVLTDNAHLLK